LQYGDVVVIYNSSCCILWIK